MEFDVYRDWVVREIDWCLACSQREVNGKDANLCARCEAELDVECRN